MSMGPDPTACGSAVRPPRPGVPGGLGLDPVQLLVAARLELGGELFGRLPPDPPDDPEALTVVVLPHHPKGVHAPRLGRARADVERPRPGPRGGRVGAGLHGTLRAVHYRPVRGLLTTG